MAIGLVDMKLMVLRHTDLHPILQAPPQQIRPGASNCTSFDFCLSLTAVHSSSNHCIVRIYVHSVHCLSFLEPDLLLAGYRTPSDPNAHPAVSYFMCAVHLPPPTTPTAPVRYALFNEPLLDEVDESLRLHRYVVNYVPQWFVCCCISSLL